jgi:hypothetical protein
LSNTFCTRLAVAALRRPKSEVCLRPLFDRCRAVDIQTIYTGSSFLAPTGASLQFIGTLLDDLQVSDAKIAKHHGIGLRTLKRYRASNNAPKAICIALWVESPDPTANGRSVPFWSTTS